MTQALLITNNPAIESEFRKIATLTDVTLEISNALTSQDLAGKPRIFIDHETPTQNLIKLFQDEQRLAEFDVALVVASQPSAHTWELAQKLQARHIALLPESREWLIEHLKDSPAALAQVFSFTPATGGAGTSTLTGAIAIALAKRNKTVVVIDCDATSVGLDVAFGMDQIPGFRWSQLLASGKELPGDVLLPSFPQHNGVFLVANDCLSQSQVDEVLPRLMESFMKVCDVIIVDNAPASLPLNVCNDLDVEVQQILVLTNTLRACAVAHALFKEDSTTNVSLVIRELPGSDLSPLSIAQSLDRPLWGVIPTDSRVTEFVEQGLLISGTNSTKYNRNVSHLVHQLFSDDDVKLAS